MCCECEIHDIKIPNHVNSSKGAGVGIFGFMNYSAEGGGPNDEVRRHNLTQIWNANFIVQPGSNNAEYISEFGDPCSEIRGVKMYHFLESQINSAIKLGNNSPAWQECIRKWDTDLEWFIDNYGHHFGAINE